MIDKELLQILACPKCKGALREDGNWLICQNKECGLQYPVRNNMPIMLIDQAKKTGTCGCDEQRA